MNDIRMLDMNEPNQTMMCFSPQKCFRCEGFFQFFPSTFQTLQLNLTILKYFCRHSSSEELLYIYIYNIYYIYNININNININPPIWKLGFTDGNALQS